MPYVIVHGNLSPLKHESTPWKVAISGLKAFELEELTRFVIEGPSEAYTVVFKHHPIVMINALEVLGYRVIASSTSPNNHENENTPVVWTMRREFPEPEPSDDEDEESSSSSH